MRDFLVTERFNSNCCSTSALSCQFFLRETFLLNQESLDFVHETAGVMIQRQLL